MGEFMFVVKTFIFTVLVLVIMQIKIGGFTLEERSLDWIHESSVVRELQDVAEGAIRAGTKAYYLISDLFSEQVQEAKGESGDGWLKIRRSEAYHKQKEKERRKETKAQESNEEATEYD